ncbi:MAG: hypothetical protein ACI3XG_05960, partial [Faecousia sp.]
MKTCKFCNAELPEGTTVCPSCGKDNAQKQTLSAGKTVLAIAAVVAVVILAAGALLGLRSTVNAQEPEVQTPETTAALSEEEIAVPDETAPPTVPADGNPDDASCKGTYTAEDEAVIAARDKVVATAGEHELTLA